MSDSELWKAKTVNSLKYLEHNNPELVESLVRVMELIPFLDSYGRAHIILLCHEILATLDESVDTEVRNIRINNLSLALAYYKNSVVFLSLNGVETTSPDP